MIFKKHSEVPREWYEITKGKAENPFLLLRFSQECEDIVLNETRSVRSIDGTGFIMELFNAKDVHINWLGKGLNFITKPFSDVSAGYPALYY